MRQPKEYNYCFICECGWERRWGFGVICKGTGLSCPWRGGAQQAAALVTGSSLHSQLISSPLHRAPAGTQPCWQPGRSNTSISCSCGCWNMQSPPAERAESGEANPPVEAHKCCCQCSEIFSYFWMESQGSFPALRCSRSAWVTISPDASLSLTALVCFSCLLKASAYINSHVWSDWFVSGNLSMIQ